MANLIIHELTHATVYKSSDTVFNEGVATFIGNKGSIEFMIRKSGKNSKQYLAALHAQHDDLLFSGYIEKAKSKLQKFYELPLPADEKIQKREKEFDALKNDFLKLKPFFKTRDYDGFENIRFNNAVFAGLEQYYGDLSLFEKIWEKYHGNIGVMIAMFKKAGDQKDPVGYLKKVAG